MCCYITEPTYWKPSLSRHDLDSGIKKKKSEPVYLKNQQIHRECHLHYYNTHVPTLFANFSSALCPHTEKTQRWDSWQTEPTQFWLAVAPPPLALLPPPVGIYVVKYADDKSISQVLHNMRVHIRRTSTVVQSEALTTICCSALTVTRSCLLTSGKEAKTHRPVYISAAEVERLNNFRFLGTQS